MDPIAFLPFILIFLLLVAFFRRSRGNSGEHRVNTGLSYHLDRNVYRLIADVTLPVGDGTTQIDHLVVSPHGIFVIETKNMKGWIFGHPDHARWTQAIFRDRYRFQNPIRQNYKHVRTVRELLGLGRLQVIGVVAFVGDCDFKTPMPPAVVQGVSGLVDFIGSRRTLVFGEDEVPRLIERILEARLKPGLRTNIAHVRNVRRRMSERVAAPGACPRCGSVMAARTNRNSGERFLGCTRYPQCKGTRPLL